MNEILLIILIVAVALGLLLQCLLLLRNGRQGLDARLDALRDDNERLQRTLRDEQRAGRAELAQAFDQFRTHIQQQLDGTGKQQRERIDNFDKRLGENIERTNRTMDALGQKLTDDARKHGSDNRDALERFGKQLQQSLEKLGETHQQRMNEVRTTLEGQLKILQTDNAQQLEKMRQTVDEKLQSTLEARLGASFKLVSERLEAVQRGLGEMQTLASGVGDLKRVLGNVKNRGIFGEVQLGALLEEMLTPDQYAANVATVPGASERVEYAIRLPGTERDQPVWLPVDAKFPREDYERLLDAQERADTEAATAAAKALENRIREEAKRIHAKYVAPPATTDFAILFLPTESLYAEVLRRPGLFESLRREHRITIAGPTTLSALLNSLQMGFRTLAIQKRSGEVWQLLGAVKTEFGKFGDILDKTKRQLDSARNNLDDLVGKRSRAIARKLRQVESLDDGETLRLLGAIDTNDTNDAESDDDTP